MSFNSLSRRNRYINKLSIFKFDLDNNSEPLNRAFNFYAIPSPLSEKVISNNNLFLSVRASADSVNRLSVVTMTDEMEERNSLEMSRIYEEDYPYYYEPFDTINNAYAHVLSKKIKRILKGD